MNGARRQVFFLKNANNRRVPSKLRSCQKRSIFKNDDLSGRTISLVSKRSAMTDWLGNWFGLRHAAPLHPTGSASHCIRPGKRRGGSVRPGWLTKIFRDTGTTSSSLFGTVLPWEPVLVSFTP
jgi:hypothetical protein